MSAGFGLCVVQLRVPQPKLFLRLLALRAFAEAAAFGVLPVVEAVRHAPADDGRRGGRRLEPEILRERAIRNRSVRLKRPAQSEVVRAVPFTR